MKRPRIIVVAVLLTLGIILNTSVMPNTMYAHSGTTVVSGLTASIPNIDGILSFGEWSDATAIPFTIQSISGTLFVMNDATNFYVAASITDPVSGLNSFQLIFDNNNDGIQGLGDDALVVNLGNNFAFDDYCNGINYLFDADDSGTNDIIAFGIWLSGVATFELKHPLLSGDSSHDFSLTPGSVVGFNIVYQPGDGKFYSGFPSLVPFDTTQFGDLTISPQIKAVDIDIKPGSFPNSINLRSRGVVPVAVLTTNTFDASTLEQSTIRLEGIAPLKWIMEDIDRDGDLDLVLHFSTSELRTVLNNLSTEATLSGMTKSKIPIKGTDSIRIIVE